MCPDTYTAPEHTSHNLTCSQGFPKPQEIWYKDEEEVKLPDILKRRDAGHYWVTVSNNLTTLNFTVDIVVHYPPSDILELENSEVQVGGVLGLKCSSVGNPRPNYSWIYYKTHNVNERTEDGVSGLIINDATGFNTGSYTCQAWNGRGNVSKTVRVTVKGAKPECPIEIEPDTMVLKYQSRGRSVVCKPQTNESNVKEIFWKTREDRRIFNRTWNPDIHENWDPSPVCHGEFLGIGRCNKTLHYILYKPPETVSIDTVNNSESTVEGGEMKLQCSIINVAPAEHLTVRWMINTTKLPELVPVIRGYTEELFCEADGNPPPRIQWHYSSGTASLGSNGTLVVKEEGIYNCTAENYLSTDKRVVQVILKEDYLPLIAGFVAVTVVIISIIFVFIYSIYYKNTKMRRYSLKNPKLSSHNGNVAHNGWDIQLPVTKLS
ncbi:hypothetical protein GOODEAATRI_010733 [Goodea atripinnis]|uniref:Ig-like domain-containing protein n=1 Tax=Goodea atripinnis TaxID=208336 RepID=A0ABV0NBY9_9TELE